MSAWVWFAGAMLLSIAEVLGAEFVLLMLGGGALVTAGVRRLLPRSAVAAVAGLRAVLGGAGARACGRCCCASTTSRRKIRTGIEAIIGSKATVVSTVDADGGQVKIGGEVWSAVSLDGHRALPPGTSVTVVEVRGATAVVIWGP